MSSYLASPPPSPRPQPRPRLPRPSTTSSAPPFKLILPLAAKAKLHKYLAKKNHHASTKEKVLSLEEQAQAAKTASILARRELRQTRIRHDYTELCESLSAPALARQTALWDLEMKEKLAKTMERIRRSRIERAESDRVHQEFMESMRKQDERRNARLVGRPHLAFLICNWDEERS